MAKFLVEEQNEQGFSLWEPSKVEGYNPQNFYLGEITVRVDPFESKILYGKKDTDSLNWKELQIEKVPDRREITESVFGLLLGKNVPRLIITRIE